MILLSCTNTATQKKFEFYYYPSRNVYYDVLNSLYLYSLDGGKNWDSLIVKTNKEPATLGTKRIIYSNSPAVWKDNAQHVSEFNGEVINITDNDSSLQTNLAADRKIKKAKAPVMNVPKPEKKPGFFKRLFGKKN
ncbi:MAG TPA: hypothetical protein VGI61_13570 [Parafilimonas sp.]|jgi:hypothetical protein